MILSAWLILIFPLHPHGFAGVVLAPALSGIQFAIIALTGLTLLIGVAKKNAILTIDLAPPARRGDGTDPREAIFHAVIARFRPIMMTAAATLLGAPPLCFCFGEGDEPRQPLGVSIVGRPAVSQALTLYTIPIVCLYLNRLRLRISRAARGRARSR